MIKVGQTVMLMQDEGGKLDSLVERWHSVDMLRLFGDPASVYTQRGSNLLFPNYPDLPSPRINHVVIPSGATRWTYGLFLTNDAGKNAIMAESSANGNVLPVEFHSENPWQGQTSEEGKVLQPIRLFLSPLQPRPLSPRNDSLSESSVQGLWLIPMVDDRYWWQYKSIGDLDSDDINTVEDLVSHINTQLGQSIRTPCLHPAYTVLPDVLDGNDNENAAVVLETLAWHIGCQLVPDVSSTTVRGTAVDSQGYVLVSVEESSHLHGQNIAGRVGLPDCSRGEDDVPAFDDGYEYSGVPSILMGGIYNDVGRGVTEKVLIPGTGAGFERSAAELNIDRSTVAGTTAVLRLKYQGFGNVPSDIGEQAIRDFYGRFESQHDYTFAGAQKWQLTAMDDYISVSRPQTRVKSWFGNFLPESPGVSISEIEPPDPSPTPTSGCGDCTNCLDADEEDSHSDCTEVTGPSPNSWFLVNDDSFCCKDSLNDINVEMLHVSGCTWESEERECKESFIEESWLTDGASPDVDEDVFYKWSIVIGSTWVVLTIQFYRKVPSENIASYSWRKRTDEWSSLCDNTLKLDNTTGLIDTPMKQNQFGLCRPACEMCVTPFPSLSTIAPCTVRNALWNFMGNQFPSQPEILEVPSQFTASFIDGNWTAAKNITGTNISAGDSLFNIGALAITRRFPMKHVGQGLYMSEWLPFSEGNHLQINKKCAQSGESETTDSNWDTEFRASFNLCKDPLLQWPIGIEVRAINTVVSAGGFISNSACRTGLQYCFVSQSTQLNYLNFFKFEFPPGANGISQIDNYPSTWDPFVIRAGSAGTRYTAATPEAVMNCCYQPQQGATCPPGSQSGFNASPYNKWAWMLKLTPRTEE